ncbi:MAG: 2,3-bisphosphoglycerate-independent phosphoglycerate mutase [Alphaproteobacteria bacterium]
MSLDKRPKPVVLCILDGWGHNPDDAGNAIRGANAPTWSRLAAACPHTLLDTSGAAVGLPDGQMGNSEVGHMTIGAGRIIMQNLPRINAAIADNSLVEQPALQQFISALHASGGAAHLLGLLSPGGVHATQDHIAALARALTDQGIRVVVHAFLDGRDTPPRSAAGFLDTFLDAVGDLPGLSIGTVTGRYYAMDRDQRWDRVTKAYTAMVMGNGEHADSAPAAIAAGYAADTGDEFVLPTVIAAYAGMQDGDGVLMANFRADRAREILTALLDPEFDAFQRPREVQFAASLGMVEYSTALDPFIRPIFPPTRVANTLGEVAAHAGLSQLRIAETEKYAHVTFFFNGGGETEYPGEERILVPSPKVATYDLQPEMSADELTDRLVAAIESDRFDLIILNYANGDMVGHTGNYTAAMQAVEAVDRCLTRLEDAISKTGGAMLITADHGNCERMTDALTGEPHTAHTTDPVPAVLVNAGKAVTGLSRGGLADIAPTILDLLAISQPPEMTGKSLIVRTPVSAVEPAPALG